MPNHFHFCCERCDLLCNYDNGDLFTSEDNILLSSVIKYHVFTWKLTWYFIRQVFTKIYIINKKMSSWTNIVADWISLTDHCGWLGLKVD